MALPKEKYYTVEEFNALDPYLPSSREFIDGEIFIGEEKEKYTGGEIPQMAASPCRFHQEIVGEVYNCINNYIKKQKGKCRVYVSPYDVKIDGDTVQPDIFVTCDPSKSGEQYYTGAPDWVIEVLSPSTSKRDLSEKMKLYMDNGAREYWAVDPDKRWVIVYPFEENKNCEVYTFETPVTVHIYKNEPEPLVMRLADYL